MIFRKGSQKLMTTNASDLNPNTIIENLFLQVFFRDLFTDVLSGKIQNLWEKQGKPKPIQQPLRILSQGLFQINECISIRMIIKTLRDYLISKSPSFSSGQLTNLLQVKYSNRVIDEMMKKNELIYIDVKIKVDLENIQKIPLKMKLLINECQNIVNTSSIIQKLKNYQNQYINFIIVYFGFYDFTMVDKKYYQSKEIIIFNKKIQLRVYAIFISKISLIQTFKTIHKVPHLEELNQLIIELYQFKRAKAKARKRKHLLSKMNKSHSLKENNKQILFGHKNTLLGIFAGVGIAVAIGKFFG